MMAAGTKPGGFNRQKKIVLIGEKHQSLSLTSFRLSLQPIHLQCQEMTGPPHFSPRPSVSIMPISPQTNDSPEWPFSQNWLPSPTKASVPAMVNLAPTGPPPEVATDGWSLPQPSSPRATLSFLAGEHLRKRGWGGGVAERQRDTERDTERDTNGHGHRGMQIPPPLQMPPWAFSGNKGPRGGRALHHCSLCSQHLLGTGRGVAAVPPRRARRSQRQHNGPGGQGQAWLSSSPPSTSPFHLHHLQERSVRRWLRATRGGGGGKYRSLA